MRNLQGWLVGGLLVASLTFGLIGCGGDSESDSTPGATGAESAFDEAGDEAGDEAATEAGDEAATEAGDEAATEAGDEAATEAGDEAATEAGEEEVEATCPEEDLTGYYDLQFKVSLKDTPSVVWMDVTKTEDENCYGGTVIAPSDGSELASVASIVQKGDVLELTFVDFLIPGGQTPLLPDGGLADVFLTATGWGENPTMCGDIVYKLKEPFVTEDTGTFAAAVQDSGFYLPTDMGYECSMIAEGVNPDTEGGEATEEEGGEATEEEGGEATEEEGGEATEEEGGEATEEEGGEAVEGGEVAEGGETVEEEGGEGEATQHSITSTDDFSGGNYMKFLPADITIAVGDSVLFEMSSTHNAVEVSKETYEAKGSAALEGGFNVGFGETQEVQFNEAGIHYFVCTPHAGGGMIGTITVE